MHNLARKTGTRLPSAGPCRRRRGWRGRAACRSLPLLRFIPRGGQLVENESTVQERVQQLLARILAEVAIEAFSAFALESVNPSEQINKADPFCIPLRILRERSLFAVT